MKDILVNLYCIKYNYDKINTMYVKYATEIKIQNVQPQTNYHIFIDHRYMAILNTLTILISILLFTCLISVFTQINCMQFMFQHSMHLLRIIAHRT